MLCVRVELSKERISHSQIHGGMTLKSTQWFDRWKGRRPREPKRILAPDTGLEFIAIQIRKNAPQCSKTELKYAANEFQIWSGFAMFHAVRLAS